MDFLTFIILDRSPASASSSTMFSCVWGGEGVCVWGGGGGGGAAYENM